MRTLNVYRGHVISLSPGMMGMGPQTLVALHSLPSVSRANVVLPDGLLERSSGRPSVLPSMLTACARPADR